MDDDPRQPRDEVSEDAEVFANGDESFAVDEADGRVLTAADEGVDGQAVAAGDPAEALGTLVAYLARNLVDEPDAVEVEARRQGNSVVVTLRVPETELGKVIGRQGRIARAVRTALTIAGSRYHVRASLDIEG